METRDLWANVPRWKGMAWLRRSEWEAWAHSAFGMNSNYSWIIISHYLTSITLNRYTHINIINEKSKIQRNQVTYSGHSVWVKAELAEPGPCNSQTYAFPLPQAAFLPSAQKCMEVAQGFGGGCLEYPPKSFPESPERRFYSGTLMATACSYWAICLRIPILIWSPQAGIPQGTCSSNLREVQKNRSQFMIDYLQSWPQQVLPPTWACSFTTDFASHSIKRWSLSS